MNDDLVDDVRRKICETHTAVPDGWKLVPVEATKEMLLSGGASIDLPNVFMGGASRLSQKRAADSYEAMLSAAPSPPDGACRFPSCTCHVAAKQSVELIEGKEKPSPAPDLVEEVARAIFVAVKRRRPTVPPYDEIGESTREECRDYARAVIPIIVARERERAARIAEEEANEHRRFPRQADWSVETALNIASAIRSNTE